MKYLMVSFIFNNTTRYINTIPSGFSELNIANYFLHYQHDNQLNKKARSLLNRAIV
jgi:hypothetical protein